MARIRPVPCVSLVVDDQSAGFGGMYSSDGGMGGGRVWKIGRMSRKRGCGLAVRPSNYVGYYVCRCRSPLWRVVSGFRQSVVLSLGLAPNA
jgi:hypothetical protein